MVLFSRRALLLGVAGALLSGQSVLALESPPRTRAWQWRGTLSTSRAAQGGNAPVALGDVARAPYGFIAVGASWARPIRGLTLRVSNDGKTWSDWQPFTTHEMHGKDPPSGQRFFGDLVIVPPSNYVQVGSDESVDDVWLDLIDSASTSDSLEALPRTAAADVLSIVPRSGWGCDETLRFDKDEFEI